MKLNEKTILITGASSGFGKAVALKCAADDCTLILSARDKEKLHIVEELLKKKNPNVQVRVIPADVTKVKMFVKGQKQRYGAGQYFTIAD